MESTTPGGSVLVAGSTTASTAQQSQHTPNTRSNKSSGRRKPRPQNNETGAGIDSVDPHPQGPDQPSGTIGTSGGRTPANTGQRQFHRGPPRPRKPATPAQGGAPTDRSTAEPSASRNSNRDNRNQTPRNKPPRPRVDGQGDSVQPQTPTPPAQPAGSRNRRAKFGGKLTENDGSSNAPTTSEKYHVKTDKSAKDDLTSRLIKELSFPPYPDCPICFSSIYREQPIWSCSPSITTILPHDAEGPPQYCWTTFHLKCIRSWASKSVKDVEDAWRARGEEGRIGDWRCPGCQAKRELVPKVYWYVIYSRFLEKIIIVTHSLPFIPGVSVDLSPILNLHDYLLPIRVEVPALVRARADVDTHVLSHVIPGLARHVKSQLV